MEMHPFISAISESIHRWIERTLSVLGHDRAPDWFSAIATVGAFWVAVIILYREMKDRKNYRRMEKERAARKVSVWIQTAKAEKYLSREVFPEDKVKHSIVVRNLGDEPIYNANVFFGPMDDNLLDELSNSVCSHVFYVVPPGDDAIMGFVEICAPERTRIGVEFTDANGVSWWREHAELIEIPERRPYDI